MFTGIVTEVGKVISIHPDQLTVRAGQVLNKLELGGSVAVNGACLTATSITSQSFTAGLSAETLMRTSIGMLKPGDPVNLERPLGLGGELGGHLVQGHVDGTGKLVNLEPATGSTLFRFEAPEEIICYLVEKGFIAIEGISLTISRREQKSFQVAVIDYTKSHTNLGYHKIGDLVNLEIDIIAKYVERIIQAQKTRITAEFLRENGF